MDWLRAILAAVGILYEILVCVVCERESCVRKGTAPEGWTRSRDGWRCALCSAATGRPL